MIEQAKAIAKAAGLTLEVRRRHKRTDAWLFRFAGQPTFEHSYRDLVADVQRAINRRAEESERSRAATAARAKIREEMERKRARVESAFKFRFGALVDTVNIGPINLRVESFDDERVSVYCQSDLTWDEFEQLLAKGRRNEQR